MKKIKNNEARPKFTGSYFFLKSVYTIRDRRTALSSDVCTINNNKTSFTHQITQNNTKGER